MTMGHRPLRALAVLALSSLPLLPRGLEAQMTVSSRPSTLAGRSTVYAPNGVVATS
jgi:hypothetical protein